MLYITLLSAISFSPPTKPLTTTFQYQGDLPPLQYFDPLNVNSQSTFDEGRAKWMREAELQHGRLAMLAAIALPTSEMMNPDTLAINYLSSMESSMQSPFWAGMFVYEFLRMGIGWNNPFERDAKSFTLKDAYQPGNLLAFQPDNITKAMYDRELSNGRLAMLACAHIIGSELFTGQGLF